MVSLISNSIALLLCVPNHVLHVLGVDGVVHIECVSAIRYAPIRVPIWEVLVHLRVLLDAWVDVLDAELVELGHVHRPQRGHLEHALLVRKHLLEEVLVDHRVRRHVELHCTEVTYSDRRTYGTR